MIHKNQPATNYKFGAGVTSDTPSVNLLFIISTTLLQFTETWGNAFMSGVMGLQWTILNTDHTPSPNTYRITAVTPWFSYDSGTLTGWISAGLFNFLMQDAKLVVNPDCTWTLTFSGLQFVQGTTVLASCGAQTMSGTSYDERLNCSAMDPSMVLPAFPTGFVCPVLPSSGTYGPLGCTMTGGYAYGSAYTTEDVVTTDATSVSGATCICFTAVPLIGGTSSYHVEVASTITGTVAISSGTVNCTNCLDPTETYYVQTTTIQCPVTTVVVKGRAPNIGHQTVATSWECDTSSGITSGSNTSTTSTAFTTCSSHRAIQTDVQVLVCIPVPVPCNPGGSCDAPPVSNFSCVYTASSDLTWPTAPPCVVTLGALDYDWSKSFRHARVSANTGTGTLWLGFSPNGDPYMWADADTGITASQCAIRWQDSGNSPLGLFYPSGGSTLVFRQTPDEGNTFTMPITITGSLAAGGFFDFEEAADFNRWFYWLEGSSAPYTIWMAMYDRDLNLVISPQATNITNADLAPVRVRWSTKANGGMRYGLEYVSSGSLVFVIAPDGIVFV